MDDELILLKEALYGPEGLHPLIRISEVREKVGPIYWRRVRRGGGRHRFLRRADFEAAKSLIS